MLDIFLLNLVPRSSAAGMLRAMDEGVAHLHLWKYIHGASVVTEFKSPKQNIGVCITMPTVTVNRLGTNNILPWSFKIVLV